MRYSLYLIYILRGGSFIRHRSCEEVINAVLSHAPQGSCTVRTSIYISYLSCCKPVFLMLCEVDPSSLVFWEMDPCASSSLYCNLCVVSQRAAFLVKLWFHPSPGSLLWSNILPLFVCSRKLLQVSRRGKPTLIATFGTLDPLRFPTVNLSS